jgi:hypothetical protein
LHQIDRESLPSKRRGFFPAYRMGIGKNSDMEGKIPTWWEKFRHVGKNSLRYQVLLFCEELVLLPKSLKLRKNEAPRENTR